MLLPSKGNYWLSGFFYRVCLKFTDIVGKQEKIASLGKSVFVILTTIKRLKGIFIRNLKT